LFYKFGIREPSLVVLDFGGENQMRIKDVLILVIKKNLQESVVFMKELVV
jgi:hypothetical protein